jgi:hypothetical protein
VPCRAIPCNILLCISWSACARYIPPACGVKPATPILPFAAPKVAAVKVKGGNEVAGKATVFIFPDLNTGAWLVGQFMRVDW